MSLLFLFSVTRLSAREFQQTPRILSPLHDSSPEQGIRPGAAFNGSIWYEPASFVQGDEDAFTIGIESAATLLDINGRVGLGLHFCSALLVGPVHTDDTAASIAEWWMNAVQYQYGLQLAWRQGSIDLVAGYGRTSLHPLRSGFGDVTRDKLLAGMVLPSGRLVPGFLPTGSSLGASLVLCYADIFDFWQIDITRPRTAVALESTVQYQSAPTRFGAAFADLRLALQYNRTAPAFDAVPWLRGGLRLGQGASRVDLYLHFYYSADTQLLSGRPSRSIIFGLGFCAAGYAGNTATHNNTRANASGATP